MGIFEKFNWPWSYAWWKLRHVWKNHWYGRSVFCTEVSFNRQRTLFTLHRFVSYASFLVHHQHWIIVCNWIWLLLLGKFKFGSAIKASRAYLDPIEWHEYASICRFLSRIMKWNFISVKLSYWKFIIENLKFKNISKWNFISIIFV